jgi:hypothetical protein
MPWTDATSPLDRGFCLAGCYASDLKEFVAAGQNGDATKTIIRSADGINWIYEESPFDSGGGTGQAAVRDLFHGVYVAAGFDGALTDTIATSPDGITWTGRGNPFPAGGGQAVACKQATGALVVGSGSGISHVIAVSSDAAAFAAISTVLNGAQNVAAVDYSPSEDLWMAAGEDASYHAFVAKSSDDGATWTLLAHPMDASNAVPPRVYRDEANGRWWLLGQTTGGHSLAVSSDGGASWTQISSPLDPVGGVGAAHAMVNAGGNLGVGGVDHTQTKQMIVSLDAGTSWTADGESSPFGAGTAYGIAYSPDADLAVVFGRTA